MNKLIPENYRTQENELSFSSCSQIKAFQECEAAAIAKICGEYVSEEKSAFAFGEYVHARVLTPDDTARIARSIHRVQESSLTHKADIIKADAMIARLMADDNCRVTLCGNCEKIITFDLDGHAMKSQLDVFDPFYIADLKTAKNFDLTWCEKRRTKVPFYEAYNYWMQFAIYREAFKSVTGDYPATCIIVAVTKESVPDISILEFADDERFEYEIKKVKAYLPRIAEIKSGKVLPKRCGVCDFCKVTKKVEPELAVSFWPMD